MLRANDIIPRNPKLLEFLLEHALDTPSRSISETSSGNGEHSKVKKETESGLETDGDESDDSMKEKVHAFSFTSFSRSRRYFPGQGSVR